MSFLCKIFHIGCAAIPTPKPVPTVIIETPAPQTSGDLNSLMLAASTSTCAKFNFPERGTAPKGFIKGIALSYAREVCFPSKAVNAPLGSADKDALAHYEVAATSANVYALMVGSAMRESSGKWCCGKDASASNSGADTAESGIWQTSFNSRVASPELITIFNDYKTNPHNCFIVYKEGITCSAANLKNWGSGDGYTFQKMAKECPAFSASFAAVTFRTLRKHYGPLNSRAALLRPECVNMFNSVAITVKDNPKLCAELK